MVIFSNLSSQTYRGGKAMLNARDLNKAIIRRTISPRQWRKLLISWLEPWSSQGRRPQGLLTGTPDRGKQQVTGNKHSQRQVQVQANALRAKMSQEVFQMKMDLIMERCPGVISIHDDIVVYGVSEEDHDANTSKPPQCSPN